MLIRSRVSEMELFKPKKCHFLLSVGGVLMMSVYFSLSIWKLQLSEIVTNRRGAFLSPRQWGIKKFHLAIWYYILIKILFYPIWHQLFSWHLLGTKSHRWARTRWEAPESTCGLTWTSIYCRVGEDRAGRCRKRKSSLSAALMWTLIRTRSGRWQKNKERRRRDWPLWGGKSQETNISDIQHGL